MTHFFLLLVLLSPNSSNALDCTVPNREAQVETASTVFIGKILRIDQKKKRIHVQVTETRKGTPARRVTVHWNQWQTEPSISPLTSSDTRYLFAVYAAKKKGEYQLGPCDSIFAEPT